MSCQHSAQSWYADPETDRIVCIDCENEAADKAAGEKIRAAAFEVAEQRKREGDGTTIVLLFEIERLTAERDRLRAALEEISVGGYSSADSLSQIAREALGR